MTTQTSAAAVPAILPARQDGVPPRQSGHHEILKSSALIGGASLINVGIGMVRAKALALLLGPTGYGVMGAYTLIVELAKSVAEFGINSSGVREIADAVGSGDSMRIERTVTVLRRATLVCGAVGALLLAALARPLSQMTFGDADHTAPIALLGVAVFFGVIAGGQTALLQGMRRVADLAKLTVFGGIFGTVICIPMVYFLGLRGLVPSLVAAAGCAVATSWWYSRAVKIVPPPMSAIETARHSGALFKLGLAFMASGLLTTGAAYAVRLIVLREAGLAAAGIYYAAWSLGGLYVGFVLQAMGTDFYPKLVGKANDDLACNDLVNEQAQVSLLLAIPGVLGTLTLAPLAVATFYSRDFAPAAAVLRWICLGMSLRVLTWPIGFIVVAKNRRTLFFGLEAAWTLVNVGLTWLFVGTFGVDGAGFAYFGSYVFHTLVLLPVVRRLSGFRWSATNVRTAACCFTCIGAVFLAFQLLSTWWALALGLMATVASGYISARILARLVSPGQLPRALRWLLQLGGYAT